jgi:hypothetical protein
LIVQDPKAYAEVARQFNDDASALFTDQQNAFSFAALASLDATDAALAQISWLPRTLYTLYTQ